MVAAARRAAQGRAQRAADHDGRPGLRRQRHVRRRHPDAGAGPHREGRTALHAVPLHRALLAHARRADHRPQPSRGRLRRDHGAVDRLSGLRLLHRSGERDGRHASCARTATPRRGSARTTTRRASSTRAAPSISGRRAWASNTSTASWAARPTSGRHTCSAITPRFFRGSDKPGYNLTTDMADEAIKHMRGRSTPPRPTSRSSSITFPAEAIRRTSRRRNGSTSSRASSTWAGTPCATRSSPTRSGSA